MVLLAVDLLVLLLREFAVVGGAIVFDLAIQIGFTPFQVLGFAGSKLAGIDAIGDAVLLIVFALIERLDRAGWVASVERRPVPRRSGRPRRA